MPHSRVAPPQRVQRLEESAQVVLLALVLAKIALTLEGRPSLALDLLTLVGCVGGLFYYWRLRPRWTIESPVKLAGMPASPPFRSSVRFSRERSRLVACMFLATLTGGGGLTAFGLGDTLVGAALVVVSGGLLAVIWRVPLASRIGRPRRAASLFESGVLTGHLRSHLLQEQARRAR